MRTMVALALPVLAGCYGSYGADDSRPDDTSSDDARDSSAPPDAAVCCHGYCEWCCPG